MDLTVILAWLAETYGICMHVSKFGGCLLLPYCCDSFKMSLATIVYRNFFPKDEIMVKTFLALQWPNPRSLLSATTWVAQTLHFLKRFMYCTILINSVQIGKFCIFEKSQKNQINPKKIKSKWEIMHVMGHGVGNPKPVPWIWVFWGYEIPNPYPTHTHTPEKPAAKPVTFPTRLQDSSGNKGAPASEKKTRGRFFFLRPPSAGLTNYIIRHMS